MPKSNKPPAFLFYVDDFSSDGKVEAMTTEEVGAYILLLCKSWREEPPGSIPADDLVLARWARLTPDRWSECKARVLDAFSYGKDGRLYQKRLRHEYNRLCAIRSERTKAAETRWGRNRNANAQQLESDSLSVSSPSSNQNIKPTAVPPLFSGAVLRITPIQHQRLCEVFGVVIEQNYREADLWLEANPEKKRKNHYAFMRNWLSREKEKQAPVRQESLVGVGPEIVGNTFTRCEGCDQGVTKAAKSLCDRGRCPHAQRRSYIASKAVAS